MKPRSIDEATKAGWVELTPEQVEKLRQRHPGPKSRGAARNVDCNNAPEGAPCGGFGGTLARSIACFCHNGLCKCYGAAGMALP